MSKTTKTQVSQFTVAKYDRSALEINIYTANSDETKILVRGLLYRTLTSKELQLLQKGMNFDLQQKPLMVGEIARALEQVPRKI